MTVGVPGGTRLPVDALGSAAVPRGWQRADTIIPRALLGEAGDDGQAVGALVAAVVALLARMLADDAISLGVSSRALACLVPAAAVPGGERVHLLSLTAPRTDTLPVAQARVLAAAAACGAAVVARPPIVIDLGASMASDDAASARERLATQWQLTIVPADDHVGLRTSFAADVVADHTVSRLLACVQRMLAGAAQAPDDPLASLPLLTDAEHDRIIYSLNQTAVTRDAQLIHERIAAQARRTPDAIALRSATERVTYRDLDAMADRLADELVRRGVGTESFVGLCMVRSIGTVLGVLAILKAQGTFVPLDPDLPAARLAYILRDTATALVLVDPDGDTLLAELAPQIERVRITSWLGRTDGVVAPVPASRAAPTNLAYVIYTSGSTGQPKGVLVTHAALSNHALWYADTVAITASDRMLLHASIGFDAAMAEIFPALIAGASVVLAAPDAHIDLRELPATIVAHDVTLVQLVPSALRVALTSPAFATCRSLRMLVCGGEALDVPLAAAVQGLLPTLRIGNFYGPSESTVDATCLPDISAAHAGSLVPIGAPIANVVCHILDADGAPVPVGFYGELHIGGVALARGYLNQPVLTAAQFIADPFRPGQRLYRTGDRARYRADGLIEFGGRLDTQVKVRGYRIELAEIEIALQRLPGVRHVAVNVRSDRQGDAQLVAYVVRHTGVVTDARAMRLALEDELPLWMIPGAIVMLDALPRTLNGKLDLHALPDPGAAAETDDDDGTLADPLHASLAEIWRQTLDVPRVRADDDFFYLGGHSLKMFRILLEVERVHGVTVRASAMLGAPTVRGLADLLRPPQNRDVFEL